MPSLLADNFSEGNGLYICTIDLSKVFDSGVHSQLLFLCIILESISLL